jgi:hypothetical protein
MIGNFRILFNRPCLVGNEVEYIAQVLPTVTLRRI